MERSQAAAIYMGIDFSCSDIRMTEHFLNHPQISTIGKQMTGKTVPQSVRMNILIYPCRKCRIFDNRPNSFPIELAGTSGNKKQRCFRNESDKFQTGSPDIAGNSFNTPGATGTTLSLEPLPVTRIMDVSKSTSINFNEVNSDTRIPEA